MHLIWQYVLKVLKTIILIGAICIGAHIVAMLTAICIALDTDQRIVSTIYIAGLVKNILVLSIHVAATTTNDIDLVIKCVLLSQGRVY